MKVSQLPCPTLEVSKRDPVCILTDNALAQTVGVRVAFTMRHGGASEAPFDSLNLGNHVGDKEEDVLHNRAVLLDAIGAPKARLITANQVHETTLVNIASSDETSLDHAQRLAQEGADGMVVEVPSVAAMLCFADCVPVIIVSPRGSYAVVHSGWRGAYDHISAKALSLLMQRDALWCAAHEYDAIPASSYNVYVGPHICGSCFETSKEIAQQFATRFGHSCLLDERHVSLLSVITTDLAEKGASVQRIVDAGMCTVENQEHFFSYRGSGGVCGRHAALAVRQGGE